MAKRGCREFHIRDEEILQLLMADNGYGEDDLQLDEEAQQFIAQEVENRTSVVEIEDFVLEPSNPNSLPSCSDTSETISIFVWGKNSYAPHIFHENCSKVLPLFIAAVRDFAPIKAATKEPSVLQTLISCALKL
ncbi:hypothetical protein EVAR_23172_1 [Eumeta japonica]|uniref:Uncharacterized protein n=1 Tax=Eumeta variegata TaxID=151549 RepID=A0A4C2AC94_EUMVA|nr:hypothetical protein EVAR_23172_1 [Eumeta japonica]